MGDGKPTSILTKAQREWLRGEREPTQERTMRTRIRERVAAGFEDFHLLLRGLPDEDIQNIFHENKIPPQEALVGFLYIAQANLGLTEEEWTEITSDIEFQVPDGVGDERARWMELLIKSGIEQAITFREEVDADVEVSITIDRGEDLETLAEGDLSRLSHSQLDQLLYNGVISREEYADANARRLERTLGASPYSVEE